MFGCKFDGCRNTDVVVWKKERLGRRMVGWLFGWVDGT